MTHYRQTLETFKNKLESGLNTNSKEFRISQNEMKSVHIALMNVLLQNAELVETNKTLVQMSQTPAKSPDIIDGGTFR